MVKNTHGGNRHKGFARKHTTSKETNKLRISEDDAEKYAIVTKMLGNNMFHCHCIDDVIRLGYIRGKFSGRRKSSHLICSGTWVLIGLREWDAKNENTKTGSGKIKLQECDLLEVYDDTTKHRLIESVDNNWSILNSHDVSKMLTRHKDDDVDIAFATEQDEERERLLEEINTNRSERIVLNTQTEEEINIDDI